MSPHFSLSLGLSFIELKIPVNIAKPRAHPKALFTANIFTSGQNVFAQHLYRRRFKLPKSNMVAWVTSHSGQ
ncbi:MAG: hypothetical protein LBK69_00345 [Syntrophomonadaceae bacterium]|jgi:hypothetical protein|nr:hypothetical protein [Syntrophomonadaceae bacterium]